MTVSCRAVRSVSVWYFSREMLEIFFILLLLHSSLCGPSTVEPASECSTVVVAENDATAEDCSAVQPANLANRTCNSLQKLLSALEAYPNSGNLSSCLEVRLLPGHYILTRNFTIVGRNLKLIGDEAEPAKVNVSFDLSASFDPTQTHSPVYVLSLVDSSLVEILGIAFWSSPGIITAQNVKTVRVQKCSFR